MADFTPLGAMVKGPQAMSMGDMVNLARGVQAYQQAEQMNPLAVQKAQQEARTGQIALSVTEQQDLERKNMQRFFADPANFQTNGRIDIDKINAAVPSIAPLTGNDYIKKYTDLGQAQTTAINARQKLTQEQRTMIGSRLSVLGRAGVQDKNAYLAEMQLLASENPDNKDLQDLVNAYKRTWQYVESGPGLPKVAIAGAQQLLSPAEQESAFGPKAGTLSTGAQIVPTITTPSVAGMAPKIEVGGTPLADVELPPTQEVISPTGERTVLGPMSQRAKQPIVTALSPTQAGALEAGAKIISEDLPKTVAEAREAPGRIAIFQNIKKLVPEAYTGALGEKKQFVASLAQSIGIPLNVLESSSTDELMKNTKLLQLAGGNTDAARSIAELANPNVHMTKEGINRVINQLSGIENMKIARAGYLNQFKDNGMRYQEELTRFNQISDPRLFQEMTQKESKELWNSLSKSEQQDLLRSRNMARSMGVIK